MGREIKFRAWDTAAKKFYTPIISVSGKSTDFDDNVYTYIEYADPLMQYTGLKDKHGVEIYEGDIVIRTSYHNNLKEVVEYRNYGFYPLSLVGFNSDYIHVLEVIGNIYENPELLPDAS